MMFQSVNTYLCYIFILNVIIVPKCMGTCSKAQNHPYSDSDCHETPTDEVQKNNRIKQALLLLFDRPYEPVFMPKGPDNTVFVIPDHYWVDRYKHLRTKLGEVYDSQRKRGVHIKERFIVKDLGDKVLSLDDALSVGRDTPFTTLLLNDRSFGPIKTAFLEASSLEDLLSLAVYVRDRYNPYAFLHILITVLLHRPDTSGMSVPCMAQVHPELLIDEDTLGRVTEENFVDPANLQIPVTVPLQNVTSSGDDEEQRVAYFREDIGLNLYHKHWHFAYANLPQYEKDRSGELFFYMHQQLIARYNFERLCNDQSRALPLRSFREPINEGYFPKLHCTGGKRHVAGRSPNSVMADVIRKKDNFTLLVKTLESWRDKIYEAVNKSYVITKEGVNLKLDEKDGIEILSNIIRPNSNSVNIQYYGGLHLIGHIILGYVHDPTGFYEETQAPMAQEFGVVMRDPIFYRWHTFLNDIYLSHKHSLPSYTADQLEFEGVVMKEIEIRTSGSEHNNALYTMWQQNKLDISQGMNFAPRGRKTVVLFSHLQHQPFSYTIQVENLGKPRKGICRIFLAPKFEKGLLLSFKDQLNMFIEMDRFTIDLRNGLNTVERKSKVTPVTIPYEKTFGDADGLKTDNSTYDRCGLPHYFLVPKGTSEGFHSQLFVMISDYETDKVDDSITYGTPNLFKRGGTMCGQRGKYPDKRPMMYPFDRMPRVDTIDEFLTTNMMAINVVIYHSSKTVH